LLETEKDRKTVIFPVFVFLPHYRHYGIVLRSHEEQTAKCQKIAGQGRNGATPLSEINTAATSTGNGRVSTSPHDRETFFTPMIFSGEIRSFAEILL
jgi:hypothetical protein